MKADSRIMTVNVSVATVWTTKHSYRELDRPAISHPVRLEEWLLFMTDRERLELSEENRTQTQLLFGDQVLLLKCENEWAYIIALGQSSRKDSRGYPGWVPLCQLGHFNPVNTEIRAVIRSKKALLILKKTEKSLLLSFETALPYIGKKDGKVYVETPLGIGYLHSKDVVLANMHESIKKGSGQDIVTCGERFVGLPYLWGGTSSYGYDCSGFTYTVHKASGYLIPRDAGDQAKGGIRIPIDEVKPGDLLFFAYDESKGAIHHVGIYYGDGRILHSPHTGKTIEIISMNGTIYEKELSMARRYWT